MADLLKLEIDLKQIKKNILNIEKQTKKKVIPVIKSNAYNMGDYELMELVHEMGIQYAAVVDMTEALNLLKHNNEYRILILNSLLADEYHCLNVFPNIAITISTLEDVKRLLALKLNRKVAVQVQVDTGMNRLGFMNLEDYKEALRLLSQNDNIYIEGLYTHFTSFNNYPNQVVKFMPYYDEREFPMVHLTATDTYSSLDFGTHVRIGMDIYGSREDNQSTKVTVYPVAINYVKKGETIGYNEKHLAEKDMKVAVLAIGYSNGFRRSLTGYQVMAKKKLYSVVGVVCMNHTFVEIDDDVDLNTEFTIISKDLPIDRMAKILDTSPHEILCLLNIKNRIYLR